MPKAGIRPGGFSFIEILVVLVILALIAGIVGTQLLGQAEKAKADSTKIQMKSLAGALDLYRLHNSSYPTSEQGLEALIRKPDLGRIPKSWQGPYVNSNSVPTDGWKNPFIFLSDGSSYEIISLGSDREEGGQDLAEDISSRNF